MHMLSDVHIYQSDSPLIKDYKAQSTFDSK